MSDIKMELVDNGLDFVLKSLESLDTIDSLDLKYTALHLYSGVLLLLKERLRFIDWKLIFQNVNKANPQSLKKGEFKSVNFHTLLGRLEKEGIEINADFTEELEWLSRERNKMEHFEVYINADMLKTHIVNLLTHLIPFLKEELIANYLLDENAEEFIAISDFLHSFEDYINSKFKKLEENGSNEYYTEYVQCPKCNQETIETMGISAKCYFCETEFADFPDNYVNHFYNLYRIIKDGGEDPRHTCVNCDYYSMIYLDEFDKYVCLSCGESFDSTDIKTCVVCGINPVIDYYDGYEPVFCDNCIDYLTN